MALGGSLGVLLCCAVGALSLFYGGLESLIGPPQMIDGSLIKSMEQEHCSRADSFLRFVSSNGITSISKDEWEVAYESVPEKVNVVPRSRHMLESRCSTALAQPSLAYPHIPSAWCQPSINIHLFSSRFLRAIVGRCTRSAKDLRNIIPNGAG